VVTARCRRTRLSESDPTVGATGGPRHPNLVLELGCPAIAKPFDAMHGGSGERSQSSQLLPRHRRSTSAGPCAVPTCSSLNEASHRMPHTIGRRPALSLLAISTSRITNASPSSARRLLRNLGGVSNTSCPRCRTVAGRQES
jgi:hypothetical protein